MTQWVNLAYDYIYYIYCLTDYFLWWRNSKLNLFVSSKYVLHCCMFTLMDKKISNIIFLDLRFCVIWPISLQLFLPFSSWWLLVFYPVSWIEVLIISHTIVVFQLLIVCNTMSSNFTNKCGKWPYSFEDWIILLRFYIPLFLCWFIHVWLSWQLYVM